MSEIISLETILSAPKSVMARRVGDEVIVLDLARGEYYGLPAVGARIWELLVDGKSLVQISNLIAIEYEVESAKAVSDLLQLVTDLCDKGLLVSTTRPASENAI